MSDAGEGITREEIMAAASYIADTIILCSNFPGKFVDRIDPGVGTSMMVALAETLEPDSDERIVVHIQGNNVNMLDLNGELVERDVTVRTYADPLYADLEAFVRLAGDNARFGLWSSQYGRIAYIYDNGPLQAITVGKDGEILEDGYYTGGNMSYAYNLDDPGLSEWGICEVFPMYDETVQQQRLRQRDQFRQLMDVVSDFGELDVTIIGPDGETEMVSGDATIRLKIKADPDRE